jgi:hypothetical protein
VDSPLRLGASEKPMLKESNGFGFFGSTRRAPAKMTFQFAALPSSDWIRAAMRSTIARCAGRINHVG